MTVIVSHTGIQMIHCCRFTIDIVLELDYRIRPILIGFYLPMRSVLGMKTLMPAESRANYGL